MASTHCLRQQEAAVALTMVMTVRLVVLVRMLAVAVRVAVPLIVAVVVPAMAVAMVAQHSEVHHIDCDAHERQQEHHCITPATNISMYLSFEKEEAIK